MKKKTQRKEHSIEWQIRKRTIVSFSVFILLGCAVYAGWRKLYTQPLNKGVQKTLRAGLQVNEKIFTSSFRENHPVKQFPKSAAVKNVRVNGSVGLKTDLDSNGWRLKIATAPGDTQLITIADIRALPKTEIIYDFKCIEGWSQVTHWGGVRFSDFIKYYHLNTQSKLNYVGLITPDAQYYVGIDMPSILQPQTLLCYEMNGRPLSLNQGYPLRLIIPVKYGIKSLKRIGTIYFSNEKPADYWAERGYDYYSGL